MEVPPLLGVPRLVQVRERVFVGRLFTFTSTAGPPEFDAILERCKLYGIVVDDIDWNAVREVYDAAYSVENAMRLWMVLFLEPCKQDAELGTDGAHLLASLMYTLVPLGMQPSVDDLAAALRKVTGYGVKAPIAQLALRNLCVRTLQLQAGPAKHIALMRVSRMGSDDEDEVNEDEDGDGEGQLLLRTDEIEITATLPLPTNTAIVAPCATLVVLFTYVLHHARELKAVKTDDRRAQILVVGAAAFDWRHPGETALFPWRALQLIAVVVGNRRRTAAHIMEGLCVDMLIPDTTMSIAGQPPVMREVSITLLTSMMVASYLLYFGTTDVKDAEELVQRGKVYDMAVFDTILDAAQFVERPLGEDWLAATEGAPVPYWLKNTKTGSWLLRFSRCVFLCEVLVFAHHSSFGFATFTSGYQSTRPPVFELRMTPLPELCIDGAVCTILPKSNQGVAYERAYRITVPSDYTLVLPQTNTTQTDVFTIVLEARLPITSVKSTLVPVKRFAAFSSAAAPPAGLQGPLFGSATEPGTASVSASGSGDGAGQTPDNAAGVGGSNAAAK